VSLERKREVDVVLANIMLMEHKASRIFFFRSIELSIPLLKFQEFVHLLGHGEHDRTQPARSRPATWKFVLLMKMETDDSK
jgi:hypothetical protein